MTGTPCGPAPRIPGVLRVRDQQRVARLIHLAGCGARGRIHLPDRVCQVRGLVLRTHDELAPQPLPPFHVHDDPGGQLPGEQPGAALQGHRFAVGGVLQEQPGRRRDQVVAVDHRLHQAGRAVLAATRVLSPRRLRAGRLVCVGSGVQARSGPAGHHHELVAVSAHLGQADGQLGARRSVRAQQAALDPPGLPGPRDGGELALHRGAGGQVHERGEELADRVPGAGAEQLAGPGVDPLHGDVRAEQEHRHRRVLEYRAQQPPLREQRLRAGAGGLGRAGGGPGPHRPEDVHRGVQLRERGLQHGPGVRTGHRGGLPEPGVALLERGHLQVEFWRAGGLRHQGPIAAGTRVND